MAPILYFLLLVFFPLANLGAMDSYEVNFEGNIPSETLVLLKSTSKLISLQGSPPATTAGLQHRAEADITNFLKVLQSQAYYNARVEFSYDFEKSPALVIVKIEPGPIYPLAGFNILPAPTEQENRPDCPPFPYNTICLSEIGITLGRPALPINILDAEENLLLLLERKGYPLALVTKKEVIADQATQSITVNLIVNSGPRAYFGPTTITGQKHILDAFFDKKIFWEEGESYDPSKVQQTQRALEASGLFSSINISHADEVTPDAELPMVVEVVEGKHRSLGFGLTYTTIWGFGVNFEWQNRNFRNMGEKLSFNSDIRQLLQETTLLYVKPDFLRRGQDLLWLAELQHETTKGFTESSYSISGTIERQLNKQFRFSYGGLYKRLHDTHAVKDGLYNLFKTPFHLRWSDANNLLDATQGKTLSLRVIPSFQFTNKKFAYCINLITGAYYLSLTRDSRYVLAMRSSLGSILGSSERAIPTSERFYEGTETSLRGYRYLTVSPLNKHQKPIGGRSLMTYTAELRVRATEDFGWVLFYDLGNVYETTIPRFDRKVLTSTGVGLRYHTPVGPLRLDVAFPLQPRSHLDHSFQVYLSIGQAF